MMDNTTAVTCVSKMGTSHSVQCNAVTKEIWQLGIKRNIWLSAAYIPGKTNIEADEESRRENQDTEWLLNQDTEWLLNQDTEWLLNQDTEWLLNQDTEWLLNQDTEWMLNQDTEWLLNPDILSDALDRLDVKPEIDLFASGLNRQFPRYVSYKPDPDAEAVNAFTMSWSDVTFYAFPPFCIIPSVLHKIIKDRARGILVVPDWPSQPWYPILARELTQRPVLVSPRESLLVLPTNPEAKHRLRKAVRLIICEVSGRDSEALVFLRQLTQSYAHPGVAAPEDNMPHTSPGGRGMQTNGVFIPFHRL